ncbi:MAG: patatin-like phospholipase family protein [Candidatus Lernaella stagnicola]|nr:patatin-like phospholipase family protein [Candidatus Lernaella stagnicola]
MSKRVKIGLALGGGAARGLAHLGVLQVLERERIPVDLIAGTSMGSLVGAVYAARPHIDKIVERVVRFYSSPEFTNSRIHDLRRGAEEDMGFLDAVVSRLRKGIALGSQVTRLSYLDREDLYSLLKPFIDDRDIRSLHIPLGVIACEMVGGVQHVFRKGSVIDAVAASSAIPGAFPPIKLGDAEYIDGGVVNMVPVGVAREMGADIVIAVNVSHDAMHPAELKRALEVYFRTHEITKKILISLQVSEADVVITPAVGEHHWADFTAAEKIIAGGREAAEAALPQIRRALRKKKPSIFRRLLKRK